MVTYCLTLLGFLLVFLTIATEIFTDKYKLLHIVRRPIPKKVSRLGPWKSIMNYLAYMCIVVNSAFISFGSKSVDFFAARFLNFNPYLIRSIGIASSFNSSGSTGADGDLIEDEDEINSRYRLARVTLFLIYILFLSFVKKIIDGSITDVPESLMNLLRRQKAIRKKLKINNTSNVRNPVTPRETAMTRKRRKPTEQDSTSDSTMRTGMRIQPKTGCIKKQRSS